jgi:RNA polymerase sigma-70 factor (ECF subfamily)
LPTEKDIQSWVMLYADDLFRWAYSKTSHKETAQDLVQETFLSAYKSLDKFQEKSKPKTWLFSILNNKIIDFHRKKFRKKVFSESSFAKNEDGKDVLENFFDNNGTWNKQGSPADWDSMDEHLLDNLDFKNVFQSCLGGLPENWSIAIHYKYLDEKKADEICKELGITTSNYWQVVHRAKLQLRLCLENNWFKSL